jgi:hypothetical protein
MAFSSQSLQIRVAGEPRIAMNAITTKSSIKRESLLHKEVDILSWGVDILVEFNTPS